MIEIVRPDQELAIIYSKLKLVDTHIKTPTHDILCKICSNNLVEDEVHLLLGCSKFNDLRRDLCN